MEENAPGRMERASPRTPTVRQSSPTQPERTTPRGCTPGAKAADVLEKKGKQESHNEGRSRPRTHRTGGAREGGALICLGGGGEAQPREGARRQEEGAQKHRKAQPGEFLLQWLWLLWLLLSLCSCCCRCCVVVVVVVVKFGFARTPTTLGLAPTGFARHPQTRDCHPLGFMF